MSANKLPVSVMIDIPDKRIDKYTKSFQLRVEDTLYADYKKLSQFKNAAAWVREVLRANFAELKKQGLL